MAEPPDLQPVAQELYALVAPLQFAEDQYDYALAKLIQALTLADEEPYYFSEDISALTDINRTPTKALPWLGQFFGLRPKPDLDDPEQRDRIRTTDGWNRGRVSAIVGAAQQYLTGAKQVSIHERDPDAYSYSVVTYADQTPDSEAVRMALLEAKPAGLNMTYAVMAGQTFHDLRDAQATFLAARTAYATFRDMRDVEPGA
jgi:hypothetical protein